MGLRARTGLTPQRFARVTVDAIDPRSAGVGEQLCRQFGDVADDSRGIGASKIIGGCRAPRHGDGGHAGGATSNEVGDSVSHIDAVRRHRVEQSSRMQERFGVRLVRETVWSDDYVWAAARLACWMSVVCSGGVPAR
jgi:hypothetical protein